MQFRLLGVTLAWAFCAAVCAPRAYASLLGLTSGKPDLLATGIGVRYTPGSGDSGTFLAVGASSRLDLPDGSLHNVAGTNRRYEINIEVDELTGSPRGGTLDAYGTVSSLGYSGLLLSGTLRSFGFRDPPSGGTLFEFTFDVTGGAAASRFGQTVGVIYNAASISPAFTGTFATSFGSGAGAPPNLIGPGTADTFVVPEPSSALALGSAFLIFRARPRRKAH